MVLFQPVPVSKSIAPGRTDIIGKAHGPYRNRE
ncbi:unnamed protein product, partial [Gongylonema pulchrum]|uniref:Methyltransferase n=1 Tax=Gongylonema pulchrum TaxID=637853 RepID=A0A183F1N2_9BILA